MKTIIADPALVSRCGLYCGACKVYLSEKCPGCKENEKSGWCKVRQCCHSNGYKSCADCREFEDPMQCNYYNNIFSKIINLLRNSDRSRCVAMIKDIGYVEYAKYMAREKKQTLRRKQ